MHFGGFGLLFSKLFPMRFPEKATAKCILGNLGCFSGLRDKDVPQEKSNPNWCFREKRLPFHRNPDYFSEKRQPKKLISRKRVAISLPVRRRTVAPAPKARMCKPGTLDKYKFVGLCRKNCSTGSGAVRL